MTRGKSWKIALAVTGTAIAGCMVGGRALSEPSMVAPPPADEIVRQPWTGPKHADGGDVMRLGQRIQRGMGSSEVVAAIGRPTRVVDMRRNHFWFYRTDDGDLSIFLDHRGAVRSWDERILPLCYKTPATRSVREMRGRVRIGMGSDALLNAAGAPDRWVESGAQDAAIDPNAESEPCLQAVYRCRDGVLTVLVDESDHTVLATMVLPANVAH